MPVRRPAGRAAQPRVLAPPFQRRPQRGGSGADPEQRSGHDRRRAAGRLRLRCDFFARERDRSPHALPDQPGDGTVGKHAVRHRPSPFRRDGGAGPGRSPGDQPAVQDDDQLRWHARRAHDVVERCAAWKLQAGLLRAGRCGGLRARHRLRQPLEPAAGPDQRAAPGVCDSGCHRRVATPPGRAGPRREPAPRGPRIRDWRAGGDVGHERARTAPDVRCPAPAERGGRPVRARRDDWPHRAGRYRLRCDSGLPSLEWPHRRAGHAPTQRGPPRRRRAQRARRRGGGAGVRAARRRGPSAAELYSPAQSRSRVPAAARDGMARRLGAILRTSGRRRAVPRRGRAECVGNPGRRSSRLERRPSPRAEPDVGHSRRRRCVSPW